MRAKFLLGALGLICLIALLSLIKSNVNAAEKGPCFLFPEGTSWYLGGRGYHHGCEDGSCTVAGKILGYDYIAASGVEILSPFDGDVVYRGHDGVGNTVIRIRSSDGKWEFGFLHSSPAVESGQHVKAGDVIAYNNAIGLANGIPHAHAWFLNLQTGQNSPDHDQFWSCYDGDRDEDDDGEDEDTGGGKDDDSDDEDTGGGKDKPDKKPATVWEKIGDFIGNLVTKGELPDLSGLLEEIKLFFEQNADAAEVTPTPTPKPTEKPAKIFQFFFSAQKPGDVVYQNNIRKFFAWLTSGKNLSVLQGMDLNNFEGSWLIPSKTTLSVNRDFGSEKYEKGQGMEIPSTGGRGDGACNAASFVTHVAFENGLLVDRDDSSHSPVPGVPDGHLATVCIDTPEYPCAVDKDVRVTNSFSYDVRLHWKVQGDTITMWVEIIDDGDEEIKPPEPKEIEINWGKVGLLIAGIVFLLVITVWIFNRHPGVVGETVLWTYDHINLWKLVFREAFKLAWGWNIVLFTVVIVTSPQLLAATRIGFSRWIGETTTVPNWQYPVCALALLINLIVRAYKSARTIQQHPEQEVVENPKNNGWRWFWIILGVIYIISPDLLPGIPLDDILFGIVSGYLAVPPSWKKKIKWIGILLLVACGIVGYLAITGKIGGEDPKDPITEPTPKPDDPDDDLPPDTGKNPYYEDFVRATKYIGVPEGWAIDNSTLELVQHESGWNPKAYNASSGAFGLFQLLYATHVAYVPEVPYGTPDPYWEAVGGFRYIRARYGSPGCAWNFWQATAYLDPSLACSEHRNMANYWISQGYAGY